MAPAQKFINAANHAQHGSTIADESFRRVDTRELFAFAHASVNLERVVVDVNRVDVDCRDRYGLRHETPTHDEQVLAIATKLPIKEDVNSPKEKHNSAGVEENGKMRKQRICPPLTLLRRINKRERDDPINDGSAESCRKSNRREGDRFAGLHGLPIHAPCHVRYARANSDGFGERILGIRRVIDDDFR